MAKNRPPVIGIIGAGKCSSKQMDLAASVGKYLAEHGAVIVCGGMGGIMEGAARGAKDGGGTTIGILPTDNKADANDYIDHPIPTGFGEARNLIVVRTADVIIAFPGKYGTLTEMAFALHAGKPLLSISAWDLGEGIERFEDPMAAAQRALELARKTTI